MESKPNNPATTKAATHVPVDGAPPPNSLECFGDIRNFRNLLKQFNKTDKPQPDPFAGPDIEG